MAQKSIMPIIKADMRSSLGLRERSEENFFK